jgi:hypothetical protein
MMEARKDHKSLAVMCKQIKACLTVQTRGAVCIVDCPLRIQSPPGYDLVTGSVVLLKFRGS